MFIKFILWFVNIGASINRSGGISHLEKITRLTIPKSSLVYMLFFKLKEMLELITLYLLYISFENKYHPIIQLIKILLKQQKECFPQM